MTAAANEAVPRPGDAAQIPSQEGWALPRPESLSHFSRWAVQGSNLRPTGWFVSIDCDHYSSTIDVFAEILPLCPTGCMSYFDDAAIHYWFDRAGEMQALRAVDEGRFGEH